MIYTYLGTYRYLTYDMMTNREKKNNDENTRFNHTVLYSIIPTLDTYLSNSIEYYLT